MTTPTRRQFLLTLAGLAAAPYVASRALAAAKPAPPVLPIVPFFDTKEADRLAAEGRDLYGHPRAIKVPSNRYTVTHKVLRSAGEEVTVYPFYHGDWDGTFKLEVCDNPAYVWADLVTGGAPDSDQHVLVDWKSVYRYGQWCDELVPHEDDLARWVSRVSLAPSFVTHLEENSEHAKECLVAMERAWEEPSRRFTTDMCIPEMRKCLIDAGLHTS